MARETAATAKATPVCPARRQRKTDNGAMGERRPSYIMLRERVCHAATARRGSCRPIGGEAQAHVVRDPSAVRIVEAGPQGGGRLRDQGRALAGRDRAQER